MKKIFSTVALILVLSMICSALLPLSTLAAEPETDINVLDFSDPSRYECEEISPAELLGMILPEGAVTDEEASYLNLCTDSFLLINKSFSNDRVSLHFNGVDSISVSARTYEYVAANGHTVTWTPVRATYLDASAELSAAEDGSFVAELPATRTEDTVFVSVDYTCSITLSAEVLDLILNRTYRDASAAKQANLEYEAILSTYNDSYNKYQQYLSDLDKYGDDTKKYEDYLKLKAEYDADLAEYNKYLSRLAKYESDLALYNKYLSDLDKYSADKAEYDRIYAENQDALNEYVEYYKKLNKIKSTMYAMESIYMKPDDGMNPLFVALQNKELVATFERYKEILSMFGVSTATVNKLSKESDELNELLRLYNDEREKSAEAAFAFYVANYEEICYKFNHLYDAMIEIMSPKIFVKMGAKLELDYKNDPDMARYKKWRILNVLSQIYLVCRCLDDERDTDGTWSFYSYDGKARTYAFHELLAQNVILSDTNSSSPEGLVWPEEVPPVILPPVPQPPTEVAKPLAPAVVTEPTPPTVVTQPTPPPVVADPGTAPQRPAELSVYDEIVELLDSGELAEREINEQGEEISLSHRIDKLVAFDNPPIITVYGDDRANPLTQYTAEYGSVLVPPDMTLERAQTERYVYTFEGWSLSPDTYIPVDNYTVEKDISIYAYFSRADRLYTVKWITAAGESTSQFKYGETPTFGGDTSKPSTDYYVYSFDGWSPAIKLVTENTTYTALYSSSDRKYTVTWSYPGKTVTELCNFGQMPTAPTVPEKYVEGTSLFTFVGWDTLPSEARGDKTYTALYEQTSLSEGDGESDVVLSESSSAFELVTEGNTVTATELLKLAKEEEKRVNVKFGETLLTIDKDAVAALARRGAVRISLVANPTARTVGEITSLELLITDVNGNPVRLSTGEIRVTIPTSRESVTNYTLYAISENGTRERLSYSFDDGEISFIAKPNRTFRFIQLYTVTIVAAENGQLTLDKLTYEAGETVKPHYYPAVSFEVAEVSLLRAGETAATKLEDITSFIMPESDVTLTVSYKKLSYTVKFVVNGKEVSVGRYEIGSTPTPPEIEQEYTEGDYRFVFAGWSPAIGAVTEDVTYVAKYNSFLGPKVTVDPGESWETFKKQTIIPFVAVGVASLAAIMALIVILTSVVRKKKKKKKAKKAN